jgi:hypothetical protein
MACLCLLLTIALGFSFVLNWVKMLLDYMQAIVVILAW